MAAEEAEKRKVAPTRKKRKGGGRKSAKPA
jgi:hypothetical protein